MSRKPIERALRPRAIRRRMAWLPPSGEDRIGPDGIVLAAVSGIGPSIAADSTRALRTGVARPAVPMRIVPARPVVLVFVARPDAAAGGLSQRRRSDQRYGRGCNEHRLHLYAPTKSSNPS